MLARVCLRSRARPTHLGLVWQARRRQLSGSRCLSTASGAVEATALVYAEYGPPGDTLRAHKHSIHPPAGIHVNIRFLASPVNPADINQIQGVYPSKPRFTDSLGTPEPVAVGGNEGVAEVIATGPDVRTLSEGDWVIMKAPGFGTWRTHAQASEDDVLRLDDRSGITVLQAATVGINPCTAYCLLKEIVDLQPGDWFIQNGANSAVGRAAIQLAKLWGLKSFNVVRDHETRNESLKKALHDLGADIVVLLSELNSKDLAPLRHEWLKEDADRLRLALNCAGGQSGGKITQLLGPGGRLVTYGGMSGYTTKLSASLLIFQDIHVQGFWVSRWAEQNPDKRVEVINYMLNLIRQGKFKDSPVQELTWSTETDVASLLLPVEQTLGEFKTGKTVFVFKHE